MKKSTLFEFAAGLLLLVSALYTYIPQAGYMYELTFISNTAGAVLFISDALYFAPGKKTLPGVLFLIEAVTIGIVFLVSVGGTLSGLAHFNFSGGMFFLHVINPLITIGFYLFAKAETTVRLRSLLSAPAFVMLYLLFDYIRFLFTGSFVYGLFPSDEMSIFVAVLIGFAAYLLTFGLGFVFCLCGKAINKRKAVRNNE